jgi:hypothetical protein
MIKTIFGAIAFVACVSGFSVNVFANEMDQVRQECEDEVAGYGIVDVNEQRQAVEDCISMRMGSGGEGEPDMSMPDQMPAQGNE